MLLALSFVFSLLGFISAGAANSGVPAAESDVAILEMGDPNVQFQRMLGAHSLSRKNRAKQDEQNWASKCISNVVFSSAFVLQAFTKCEENSKLLAFAPAQPIPSVIQFHITSVFVYLCTLVLLYFSRFVICSLIFIKRVFYL